MRRSFLVASLGLAAPPVLIAVACSSASPVEASDAAARPDAGELHDGAAEDLDGGIVFHLYEDVEAGGACEASADCPPGLVCWYPIAEGCAASGVCTVLAASKCGGPYCTCRGDTTAVCGDFGQLPMLAPLRGPPCAESEGDASGTNGEGADE